MVSMKDIARRCGVSVATVSKALNDQTDISEATKKRVREAARELGYLPNSSARALKTNRTYNLGVLFSDEARNGLTHDYFAHVLNSFKVTAEAEGFDITFINSDKTRQKMTYLEHSLYRGVDGVIIACVDFDAPEVLDLVRSNLPVVTIDHSFDVKPSIVSDNITGMRELIEYIHSRGHRRIAYIHGGDNSSVTQNRLASFHRTMRDLGLSVPDSYILPGRYREIRPSYDQTMALLGLPEPPTCIVYPDDLAAIGGINALREQGLRFPEDISIAGYDGLRIGQLLEPRFTTISQDTDLMGRQAAIKLISMIEHPKSTLIDRTLISGHLIRGSSVGDCR